MQRRHFIRQIGLGTGLLATPVAMADRVHNSDMLEKGQELAKDSADKLKQRLADAEQRIDQLQSKQKKTIKTGLVLAGLVVGLDLSLLI